MTSSILVGAYWRHDAADAHVEVAQDPDTGRTWTRSIIRGMAPTPWEPTGTDAHVLLHRQETGGFGVYWEHGEVAVEVGA